MQVQNGSSDVLIALAAKLPLYTVSSFSTGGTLQSNLRRSIFFVRRERELYSSSTFFFFIFHRNLEDIPRFKKNLNAS